MIAKSIFLFIALIILPDVILWYQYFRKLVWWKQLLWFIPGLVLLIATILLAGERDFVPDDMTYLNIYLLVMGMVTLPKTVFAIGSFFGRKALKVNAVLTLLMWYVLIYGSFFGVKDLEVKHVDLSFKDLPAHFEGYRIVQFSDIHLGSIDRGLLERAVDSIKAQRGNVVVFTGDIQNKEPKEILQYQDVLSKIKAEDGVISIIGNHDYSEYIDAPYDVKAFNEELTIGYQQDMGWGVLVNGRRPIKRGDEQIYIAGMDNDGEGRFPQKGNINRTLYGLSRNTFVVMLEHDPSSWRRKILPHSHAQLTLSGHTHGMQFSIFGWIPLTLIKKDVCGLSQVGDRYLYVSKGLGGVVPFRFGSKPEIVVITLHRK